MSVFQSISLLPDTIKVRWQEPYVTTGLNQKTVASHPRGVVAGFNVVPNIGFIVEIQTDPILGLSVANVLDTTGGNFSLTVFQPTTIQIDLSGQAGSTVFLVVDAQYAVGSPTAAQIRVVDQAELNVNPDLVPFAKVVVPVAPPVLVTDINMGYAQRAGDSVPVAMRPSLNLLFNPGFESDVNLGPALGWLASGGAAAVCSTDFAKSGTKSLKITAVTATSDVTAGPMPVIPGEKYVAGAWLRTAVGGVTGTGFQLRVLFLDKAFALLSTTNIEASMTGVVTTFVQRRAQVTAPATAAHAQLQVFLDASTASVGYVDDFEFMASRADAESRSPVFGGPAVVADQYHTHTAGGQSYAGGPNWADGSTNPPTTVEGQFDKILTDLGGVNGAAKIGFTPASPVDLTAVRVDTALNELDDKKAGIDIANTFSRHNVFNNTGTLNATAITASGNGTGAGIISNGSIAGSDGVLGVAIGAGFGITGNSPGGGVRGLSTSGNGVTGSAGGTGSGVLGQSGSNPSNFGGPTLNPPAAGPSNGGTFFGGTNDAGGDGLQAWGRGDAQPRTGVVGVGSFPSISGTAGGSGGQFYGGTGAAGGDSDGGSGVVGFAGAKAGTGLPGAGVFGQGNSQAGAFGVRGVAGPSGGIGVRGESNGPFTVGVHGLALASGNVGVSGTGTVGINTVGVLGAGGGTSAGGSFQGGELGGAGIVSTGMENNFGVWGIGGGTGPGSGVGVHGQGGAANGIGVKGTGTGSGVGVVGLSNAASSARTSTGVVGRGLVGGHFSSNGSGAGAHGLVAVSGVDGTGGVFSTDLTSATGNGISSTCNATTGYGVQGIYASGGTGAGVRGESSSPTAPAGSFVHSSGGLGIDASGAVGASITGVGNVALRLQQSGTRVSAEVDGYLDLSGGAVTSNTEPYQNMLTKDNVCKAWCTVTHGTAGGTLTVTGFNVKSVTRSGNTFTLLFADAGGSGSVAPPYVVQAYEINNGAGFLMWPAVQNMLSTGFDYAVLEGSFSSASGVNIGATIPGNSAHLNAVQFTFIVFGRQ